MVELVAMSSAELGKADLGLLNLACAEGLPGAEGLDPTRCLRLLDEWASRVQVETERHLYRFQERPAEYEHSEAYFRMLMMAVVLYEDFGVRYNPERITTPGAGEDRAFFGNSQDLFLHGLCGTRRMGTCSSMPVLYAAIGRRLGYPLRLATTKGHVFLRWEDQRERFNLEATGKGMNRYDDSHFRNWPYPVSDEEIEMDGWLRSLSAQEEVALFLSLRAQCLLAAGRHSDASAALEHAIRLAPESRSYRLLASDLRGWPLPQQVAPVQVSNPYSTAAPSDSVHMPDPNAILQNR